MRRSGQKWIFDTIAGMVGMDAIFPDAYIGWIEQGMKLMDYKLTMGRVRSHEMMGKSWSKTATQLEELAIAAEQLGHTVTAGEFYHRSAIAYGKAFWAGKQRQLQGKVKETYAKAAAYAQYPIDTIEVPFGDRTIPCHLHLPSHSNGPVPCVIFVPGMDMIKEDFPNIQCNPYVRRGMAIISMDGPGQGESLNRGLYVNLTNYQEAVSAVVTYLTTRPEIDSEKIGVFGCSMGSYWAPSAAALDHRIKACAGAMGCYLDKHRIFELAPPGFKQAYMQMAGMTDEDEFDKMAAQMSLERYADKIKCPVLLPHGEFDQLCTVEDARQFFQMLKCPKELWIYENEFHGIGRWRGEMFNGVADWMKAKLVHGCDPDLVREVLIPEWR